MPIYDNNLSVNSRIDKIYDNNLSVNTSLSKIYDNNGTANTLVYQNKPSENIILPGTQFSQRGNTITPGTIVNSNIIKLICTETSGIGNSNTAYTYVDLTGWAVLHMDIDVLFAHKYAFAEVGIGNFDSFDSYTNWVYIDYGWGFYVDGRNNSICPGNYGVIEGAQSTKLKFELPVSSIQGVRCVGIGTFTRSSINASTTIQVTKIWLTK